jgi:hypothetical protein
VGVSAFHKSLWPVIVRRYDAGEEMKLIAQDLGVDRKTVYNVARRAGLPNRHIFDSARTDRILSAYQSGTPVHEIATVEKVHRTYVRNVARRAGLAPRRDWQRLYPLNERAFDDPTPVGWWLVGLIGADGSFGKGNLITITQTERDVDVLHAFLAYVGCPDRPLTELKLSPEAQKRAWPRSRAYEARVFSRHMGETLGAYGVTRTKTKTLRFSTEAAAEPAVWLGLLDGDGWVSLGGKRGRAIIDFCGTPAVMRQCSRFWGNRLTFQGRPRPRLIKHHAGLARVQLSGRNATKAARMLLQASPTSLRRKRRTLEAIAALDATVDRWRPYRMRTSANSK